MTTQTLTLEIGDALYQRLLERASRVQRTVEAEALDLVAQGVLDQIEPELEAAITELRFLDDSALWQAARIHMDPAGAAQLETLHTKRQREGLSAEEAELARVLAGMYERAMVIRAEAAALLYERGYDVSELRSDPPPV